MPLTSKGKEIMANMRKTYGAKKGKRVFYAARNKGTIDGVDRQRSLRARTQARRATGY